MGTFDSESNMEQEEQQLRFAYLQAGEVIVLATGNIVNFGVSKLVLEINHCFLRRALC